MYCWIFGIFVFERVSVGVCLEESMFFFCFEWLCFSLRENLVFSLDLLQHGVFFRFSVYAAKPQRFVISFFLSFFLGFNLNTAQVKKMYELWRVIFTWKGIQYILKINYFFLLRSKVWIEYSTGLGKEETKWYYCRLPQSISTYFSIMPRTKLKLLNDWI